jgi:hypothetical protein
VDVSYTSFLLFNPFFIIIIEMSTEATITTTEQKPFDRELKILSPPRNAGPIRKLRI